MSFGSQQGEGGGLTRPADVAVDSQGAGYDRVFIVSGHSMFPALPDGSTILVDYQRTTLRDGNIYLFSSNASLLVKRARRESQEHPRGTATIRRGIQ